MMAWEEHVRNIEFAFELSCQHRRERKGLLPKSLSVPCSEEPCWKDCPWNTGKSSEGFYDVMVEAIDKEGV